MIEKVTCPCLSDTRHRLRIRIRYNLDWQWGCALCGIGWGHHARFDKDRRCNPEISAVYRVGGLEAVLVLVHEFPDKYPRILKRLEFDLAIAAERRRDAKQVKSDNP